MEKNKNFANLAKGTNKKPTAAVKPVVKQEVKVVEKPKTPEEQRDIKAKEKVEELLKDVELTPKKEEVVEVEVEIEQPKVGTDWLEEQVTLLSEQNEFLRSELSLLKNGGSNDNDVVKAGVVRLFNELQNAHLTMGYNQDTHAPNLIIAPVAFLNRLIMFFPFLEKEKKFH